MFSPKRHNPPFYSIPKVTANALYFRKARKSVAISEIVKFSGVQAQFLANETKKVKPTGWSKPPYRSDNDTLTGGQISGEAT